MATKLTKLARLIERDGRYTVERTGGEHYRIRCGRQQVAVIACSSGDRMAWLALVTDVRRAGHPDLAALLKANRP